MTDLREELFGDHFYGNPLCEGCSILDCNKPMHSHMDYENLEPCDVLFLSDSFKYRNGNIAPFSRDEYALISSITKFFRKDITYGFSASIKCPSVKDKDIKAVDKDRCRQHLIATIEKLKPKIIFTCGNLALKMINKVGGLDSKDIPKRGRDLSYTLSEHECYVVPVYHPFYVIQEPSAKFLFESDIVNALNRHFEKHNASEFTYTPILSIADLQPFKWLLDAKDLVVSVDIETTGLDFVKDKIQTVSMSFRHDGLIRTIVFPFNHKESPFSSEEFVKIYEFIETILENPDIVKVFHNAPFDCKFFKTIGIDPCNIRDTKILHHMIQENTPNSLMELVNIYFPKELMSINANSN